MLTQSLVRELFHYDPISGLLVWNFTDRNIKKGTIAGSVNSDGYVLIRFNRCQYFAHRLIWLYVYGDYPKEIDHKNSNPSDNRLSNLRKCTRTLNNANTGLRRDNRSGVKGVCWNKRRNKWFARLNYEGKQIFIGYFDSIKEAAEAYDKVAVEMFGDFALTNSMLNDRVSNIESLFGGF